MARRLIAALIFVAACTPAGIAHAQISTQQVEALDRQGASEIVVRREPGLNAAERADVRADADVTLERRSTLPDTEVVRADEGELAEAVAELNRDPDVVYAEPVTVLTAQSADSYSGSLWGLENVGQRMFLPGSSSYYPSGTPDADMDVPEAWTKATGAGVTVGIVDTGMLVTHPDLVSQVATNAGETGTDGLGRDKRSNRVDDDGNGYVDDWHGWDFVSAYPSIGVSEGDDTAGPDNDTQDNHGHGTHVAGTVAAQRDNNEGIAGVAPGAKVMPLRALGATGSGTNVAIAEAFAYAGKMGLRVVNASLGGPGLDQTQLSAIQAYPNTLYVIAAGNSNVDNDSTPHGPCALPAANILCVGASDVDDRRAGFSNYGAQSVDVFAPGTAILSTYTGPAYTYLQGTSMASPNTAGVAALVLSAQPGASALSIKSTIMASAEPKPDLSGKAGTGGRVNADRAVTGAIGGAPVNVTPPVITGTPRQGVPLGTSTGTWNPPGTSYAYVWQRSSDGGATWTAIVGATAATYTPGASDIGARLRVTVTATNPYGVASATSAAVAAVGSGAPVNTGAPTVNGTPRRGQVLTVTSAWDPAGTSYAYQWQRSFDGTTWTSIGSNAPNYTLTTADRDARVRATVTATNSYGQASATSAAIGPVVWDPPVNAIAPAISGTTQRTFTLSAQTGTWDGSGNAYRYQWQRDAGSGWAPIAGATAATYKLGQGDEGARVRVVVTATNPDGSVDRASDATVAPVSSFPPANTAAPVVTGTAQRGRALSATRGTWTGPDNFYGFQWQRDFGEGYVDIAGATGSAYTLTVQDVDALVRVVVTATNVDGTIVEASDPTAPVLAAGPLNQSPPTVAGTAQRGLTLTGTTGTWSGIGNTTTYQWQSSTDGSTWVKIAGATSTSYAIGAGSVGSFVRLLVTVTNPDGTASTPSAPTAKVIGSPPVNTAKPTVSGTTQRGSTLTATTGSWSGIGNGYVYQWQRDGVDIADAANPAYTLTAADVGTAVRVVVTATNPDATASAASAATGLIPGAAPVNTVKPAVSGTAQRGLTLTGTPGTWSGIGNSSSYEWQASTDGITWTKVGTHSTYTIGVGDVGRNLRLEVTMTNPEGTVSAAGTATAKVIAAPPVNTAKPALSGTAQRGSTLTATTGTWTGNGNAYAYQWQRDGADIADATAPTYTLAAADVGAAVRVVVTATNPDATVTAASAATATIPSAPPVNTAKPAITGTAQRGSTLTATGGTWSGIGNAYTYQWQRDGIDIARATGTTYELTVADVGAAVRVVVTATNPDATVTATSAATATIPSAPPVNTAKPAITGTARRGSALTGTAGTWSGIGNSSTLRWQRSRDQGATWQAIDGATSSAYTLTVADVGALVRVLATTTNPEGTANAASSPTATIAGDGPVNTIAPTISGSAQRTAALTSKPGTWSGNANVLTYQWQRSTDGSSWTNIAGATSEGYELAGADVGATVRLLVTATNPDGTSSRASAPSATVKAAPPVNTALPTVTGATLRGTTLTASKGTWTGPAIAYAYQWQRDGVDIAGATGATYTLGVADVNASVRVRVTATNADASVTVSSPAVGPVRGGPPVNTLAPAISGTAKRTATLTSTRGEWGGIENDYAYQWQRRASGATQFTDVAGATGSTYALGSADVGGQLRLKVTATNLDGTLTVTTASTSAVTAAAPRNVEPPAVSGPAKVGATLTAAPGAWTPADAGFAYTWQRDGVDAGTGASYTLQAADAGKTLRVKVTATNVDGSASATSAATAPVAGPPANLTAPGAPSGTAKETFALNAAPGRWDAPDATFSYVWMRCASDALGVSDACENVGTGETHVLGVDDIGRRLGVRVTATASGGETTVDGPVSATVAPLTLLNSTAPSISGKAYPGEQLTGDAGRWTHPGAQVALDWQRCAADGTSDCASLGGDGRYTLTADDVGRTVVLAVTATAPGQRVTARSAPLAIGARPVPRNVGAPVVTGTTTRGRTLRADRGTWSNSPDRFSYAWLRCDGGGCREIDGATGDAYELTKADEGRTVSVVVTAANGVGSATASAAPVGPVAAAPPVNTRVPVISGTVQQGATLTAGGATWDATSDTVYGFAWLRCDAGACAPIAGATGAQYTLLAADVGKTFVAVITASNVDGSSTARSAETVIATLAGPRWRTLPLISNSAGRVGDDVTVTPGTWSGPVVTSDTTELMRCTNVCVSRGTNRSYTIADSDLGAILRVRETAANVGGETTVWSARYVGPVVSAQAAAGVLSRGETQLRNAQGSTLAVAKLSVPVARAAAKTKPSGPKVTLRRSGKVKGKLVAWACPATVTADGTPPPCSAKVTLRKTATLKLPAAPGGKVRVVVVQR